MNRSLLYLSPVVFFALLVFAPASVVLAGVGTDCSFVNSERIISSTECDALLELYSNTDGANWTNNSGWGVTNDPCSWYGVTCGSTVDGGHVAQLDLNTNALNGSLPRSLGDFTHLNFLDLSSNTLPVNIPPQLGNLTSLTRLFLDHNQLTGTIPPELGNLANLTQLRLDYNQLTGAIPLELGNLTLLSDLRLRDNQLTGTIPSVLANLTSLTILRLNNNKLSGSIPTELGNLTNLTQLRLNNNILTGEIPTSLENLVNLDSLTGIDIIFNCLNTDSVALDSFLIDKGGEWKVDQGEFCITSGPVFIPEDEYNALVDLYNSADGANWKSPGIWPLDNEPCSWTGVICSDNVNYRGNVTELLLQDRYLSGSLASSLGTLTQLQSLNISINPNLTGAIPTELGNLTNLTTLILYQNNLSGTIPKEFGNLVNLTSLRVYSNQLTGTIPTELGNLVNLTTLSLSSNMLCGAVPVSLMNLTNLNASVGININNNNLYSNDAALNAFLVAKGGEWQSSQGTEVCPSTFSWNLFLPAIIGAQ